MTRQENAKRKKQRIKYVAVICAVLILSVTAGILIWVHHIRRLRNEMENHIDDTISFIERGVYDPALTNAEEALALAQRLREDEAIGEIGTYIKLVTTVIRGNELLKLEKYNEALDAYLLAAEYASDIDELDTKLIDEKITLTEMYLTYYSLIGQAEFYAAESHYEEAISVYEDAKLIAAAIPYSEGISNAEAGINKMRDLIIVAMRKEAAELFFRGVQLYGDRQDNEALVCFRSALDIYLELDDMQAIEFIKTWIDLTEQRLAPGEDPEQPPADDVQDNAEEAGEQSEITSNYEHNISISFDLHTLIDNQNQYPANQIRMGSTEGMNEGWYNGCGWVAVYNALILLGNPKHPAEIVEYFEESGGTVLDGVYGTYPNAIEGYFVSLGYNIDHIFLPQLTTDIDEAIKSSQVSILAYLHSSAAHYIAVEYREDIDRFIVYNDSFARTRSTNLGFQNDSDVGAAIDSLTALINRTTNILFSFSLITVV